MANVNAYNTSIKPIENVPIVSAATSYDNPVTGDIFDEPLYYGNRLTICSFT
jgi:hypothetical protein